MMSRADPTGDDVGIAVTCSYDSMHSRPAAPMRRIHALVIILAALASLACIWDRDTIDDELRGVPDAFDLIIGHWPEHGAAYYQARVNDLPALIEAEPSRYDLYDDLAVAYERLERRDEAIAVMHDKAAVLEGVDDDEARYRLHANLGTFLAHDGQFDTALVELEPALEINPDAHFGREHFQVDAIRYVALAAQQPDVWTNHNYLTWSGYGLRFMGWYAELYRQESWVDNERVVDTDALYEGTAGMLRFGGLESAELYRTLGDLHLIRGDLNLAWWAWQRAKERGHPSPTYLDAAIALLEAHWVESGYAHVPTRDDYRAARAWAEAWRAAFEQAEADALSQGLDPSDPQVLAELVAQADAAVPPMPRVAPTALERALASPWNRLLVGAVAMLLASVGYVAWRVRRARVRRTLTA